MDRLLQLGHVSKLNYNGHQYTKHSKSRPSWYTEGRHMQTAFILVIT